MLKIQKKNPYKTMTYRISKDNACYFRQTWYNSCILTKQKENNYEKSDEKIYRY